MGTVSLHAIGIDELRDAFAGTDAAVGRLRSLALATWPPEDRPGRGSLLSKLGPFSRQAVGAPVVRPEIPTGRDVDDVAHGREVPPDRRTPAWALVDAVIADTAWDSLALPADDRTIDDLDFALASAGLPSRYGLRQLFDRPTGIPVKKLPGMADGYVRRDRAEAMASAWTAALPDLAPSAAPLARRITQWLAGFPVWAASADEAGRPAPDLVVWYRPD